jgi:phage terminase large subunit-like protein
VNENLRELSRKEQKVYDEWLQEKAAIQRLKPVAFETEKAKETRIKKLAASFTKFCSYYFEEFMDSEFGWFHLKAVQYVEENTDIILVCEWPREHAKSVVMGIFLPMYLKAKGELTGVVLASANGEKANGLLADLQEQLMFNARYISDFGQQYQSGKWETGHFVTNDGVGFWAFGRGQSPRGVREAEKRPNFGLVDDIDDAEICKNEKRVDEAVDWCMGDLYGCLPTKGSRFVVLGNRIHKKSILAKIVGDVEEDDPKKEDIVHLKVYALENPKTHKMDVEHGVPAWPRYNREHILKKMNRMGYRIGLRELFHQHIVIGKIFREEHLPWAKLPPLQNCDKLVTYCDPSWKDRKKSDFKAILLIGKNGPYYDIYKAFCRRCSTSEMARGHYNLAAQIPENKTCPHWIEAILNQDLHLTAYDDEAEERGYDMAIRPDYRSKPDKTDRIENLTAYTERGFLRFNIAEKHSPDMQEVRNQFLGFPDAPNDDGPDAGEGGIFKLNKAKEKKTPPRAGKYKRNSARRI